MRSVRKQLADFSAWITILSETILIANLDPQNEALLQGFYIFHKETSRYWHMWNPERVQKFMMIDWRQ